LKVVFDNQIFSNQKYGGISRYFARIASEMRSNGVDAKILAGFHINSYLKEKNDSVSGYYFDKYPKRSIRAFRKLNKYVSNIQASLIKPDIIHETYFSSKPIIQNNAPVIVTVYDMIQELFSDLFDPSLIHTKEKIDSLKRADHILSIPHHTKKDLCDLFNIAPEKVSVVHLAADEPLELELIGDKSFSEKPYFLYVGLRLTYKNFQNFLHAFAASEFLKKEMNIIAFGGGEFSAKEKELFSSLGLREDQMIQIGGNDQILANLYSKAYAFIYPSLYEGFGIPPLEAMAYNCPVLSSNVSSMPEVIGDAALFFNPNDLEEIRVQMEKVVLDQNLREELILKGKEKNTEYSWEKTAEETSEVYKKVIAK
jgi:glycosyltransferase involved in cell wall biosynthesis